MMQTRGGRCLLTLPVLAVLVGACAPVPATVERPDATATAASPGPEGTPPNGQAVEWRRSGGFAGVCQYLTVDWHGRFGIEDCSNGKTIAAGNLDPVSWDKLEAWLQMYASFVYDSPIPPGAADMFMDHLQFNGNGQVPATIDDKANIADEVGRLADDLVSVSPRTTPPGAGRQGIEGQSVIGPMCPVVSDFNSCPDRPYPARFQVLDAQGQVVTSFDTAADGTFKLELPPGDYVLLGVSDKPLPRPPRQDVTVTAGQFTQVTLSFDSGIR